MMLHREAVIDTERLAELTKELWECLMRVRISGGTLSDGACMAGCYESLRELLTESYQMGLDDASEQALWFTKQVMDAYRDLLPHLKLK